MRQRNDSGYELHVMAWPDDDHPDRQPFTVGVGEEIDYPDLIGGFSPVEVPDPEPVKAPRKNAAAAAELEGGEPQ